MQSALFQTLDTIVSEKISRKKPMVRYFLILTQFDN